jgi:hypothetical protein
MPPNIPLSVLIPAVLRGTPPWVWGLLALLVALGALQMRDHVISRTRLMIAPLALGGLGLWGAASAFGANATVLLAWLAGLGAALAANRALRWPRQVRPVDGGFALAGSPWPLLLMLAIFALRYVVTVSLVLHPQWRADALFSLGLAALYGALSGLFSARALRIWHSGSLQPQALPA